MSLRTGKCTWVAKVLPGKAVEKHAAGIVTQLALQVVRSLGLVCRTDRTAVATNRSTETFEAHRDHAVSHADVEHRRVGGGHQHRNVAMRVEEVVEERMPDRKRTRVTTLEAVVTPDNVGTQLMPHHALLIRAKAPGDHAAHHAVAVVGIHGNGHASGTSLRLKLRTRFGQQVLLSTCDGFDFSIPALVEGQKRFARQVDDARRTHLCQRSSRPAAQAGVSNPSLEA